MTVYVFNKTDGTTDELIKCAAEDIFRDAGGELPKNFSITRSELGKPYVNISHMFVSVSHTDDIVLVAVNGSEVGIDIENSSRKTENIAKIAERFFSEWEKSYVFSKEAGVRRRFLEVWVKKEAYYKFLGGDIRCPDTFSARGTFIPIRLDGFTAFAYSELVCLNCINVKNLLHAET